APNLMLERANATSDLDSKFVEKLTPHSQVVQTCGDVYARHGRQAVLRILNEELNTHRFETGDQRHLILLVPAPAVFETFLENDAQGFPQRINDRYGRRVVVRPLLAPEIHNGGQIEIPALNRSFTVAQNFFRARP